MKHLNPARNGSAFRMVLACCLVVFSASMSARALPPLYAEPHAPVPSFSWLEQIEANVPPLVHDRGDSFPMILWEAGPFTVQPIATYQALLARGLTQHIQLDESMIPTAQALKAAGSPVIMMQGAGGTWPSSLAGAPAVWAHLLDADFHPSEGLHACPAITKGWAIEADAVRATLQKFKDAGVTVDGVWMDWEGDPVSGGERYQQAIHCSRCRATLPPDVLESEDAFGQYCWRRYQELTGTYLAAPAMEIFPSCSTTNWRSMISTAQRALRSWAGRAYPPSVPAMFSASNPVAYGNTVLYALWNPKFKFDREHVDQFYTHYLLDEVSGDAVNRAIWAPGRVSIPWVGRWVPDDPDPTIPIVTRERYREVLRHLWLRGTSSMQIFNPLRPGYEDLALAEVQDAVAVYDEMLQYRDFLQGGEVLGLGVPKTQDESAIWSGLRLGDRAIVRTFKQGVGKQLVVVEPWPKHRVWLVATPVGKTYSLTLKSGRIVVEP